MKTLAWGWTLLTIAWLSATTSLYAALSPWFETPESRVRMISAWNSAPAEPGDARLGLHFQLQPGWHVYWKNPGDAGYPPAVELVSPSEIERLSLLYPAPRRYLLPGELEAVGYDGEVVYPLEAALGSARSTQTLVRLRLDYLVCAETCIPYTAELGIDLPRGDPEEDTELANLLARWQAQLPLPVEQVSPPLQVSVQPSPRGDRELLVQLGLSGPGLRLIAPELFLETLESWQISRPELVFRAEGPAFRIRLRRTGSDPGGGPNLPQLAWTLTGIELAGKLVAVEGRSVLGTPDRRFAWFGGRSFGVVGLVIAAGLTWVLVRSRLRRRP